MLTNHKTHSSEAQELLKEIRNECLIYILSKNNKAYCNCRIKACFHAGQLDLALKIMRMTGFEIEKLKHIM